MAKFRRYKDLGIFIMVIVLVLVSLAFAFSVRRYGWPRTGFFYYTTPKSDTEEFHPSKTLWDWMELLIIPLVLAGGGLLLNRAQRQRELEIAKDREEERAVQSYLEAMTELLLEKNLRTSKKGSEVKSIARARTLTILRSLSGERKSSILRFLYEAELIDREKTVIDLEGADLKGAHLVRAILGGAYLMEANLVGAHLEGANLEGAKLWRADLWGAHLAGAHLAVADLAVAYLAVADLAGADLAGADLKGADLKGAYLMRAILRGANLEGANLERARLQRAELSEDPILPDGTKWTPDTDMARFTDPDHPDFWRPDA